MLAKSISVIGWTAVAVSGWFIAASAQTVIEIPKPGYCPKGVQDCRVMTLTPDEEKSLLQPGGIFDQAEWANRSGMSDLVRAWKQKIATSPKGMIEGDGDPAKSDKLKK